MWHGGGLDKQAGRAASSCGSPAAELELGPTISIYQAPMSIGRRFGAGPPRQLWVRIERHASPLTDHYLAVTLEGRRALAFTSPDAPQPSLGRHRIGRLAAPEELRHGDLAAFEPSSEAVEFEALTDTEFVLGSAVRTGTTSSSATTRSTRRRTHFAMRGAQFRGSGRA